MCAALIDMIGYDAEKEGGKQILEETFVSPLGAPKYMQKVLNNHQYLFLSLLKSTPND